MVIDFEPLENPPKENDYKSDNFIIKDEHPRSTPVELEESMYDRLDLTF
jgi:hypothetical protein